MDLGLKGGRVAIVAAASTGWDARWRGSFRKRARRLRLREDSTDAETKPRKRSGARQAAKFFKRLWMCGMKQKWEVLWRR